MTIEREFVAEGAADPNAPFTMSWSHESDGGDTTPILIGFSLQPASTGALERNVITPTVTVGDKPAMLLAARNLGVNDNLGTVFVYIIWDVPGTNTVQVSTSNSAGTPTVLHGTSVSYTGVRGVHAVQEVSRASVTNPSIQIASAEGRKIFHVGANSGTTFSGYSAEQLYTDNTDLQRIVVGDEDGAPSVTISYTTGTASMAQIAVELIDEDDDTGLVLVRSISRGSRVTGQSTSMSAAVAHLLDVSDSNTLAVVAVEMSIDTSGEATCSASWGGQAMTLWGFYTTGSGIVRNAVGLFYRFAPPTGESTVQVSAAGGGTKRALAVASIVYDDVEALFNVEAPETATSRTVSDPAGWRAILVTANGNALTNPEGHEVWRGGAATSGAGDYGSVMEGASAGANYTLGSTTATASVAASILGRMQPVADADVGGSSSGFFAFFGGA